ncbi:MAG: hypothetical protein K0S56_4730 [Microvirga sp.]|nr:hypothetical protein [Microvirga sp.]
MNLSSTLETAGWSRKRSVLDLVILGSSFLLFLWLAYEFSLFGAVAGKLLDPAKRIDFYETLAAGAFLFCALWIFALRRASELRAAVRLRGAAERRASEADFRARHDPLTGLGNRAKFDESLASMMKGETTPWGSGALLLLDLNGFKNVNDQFGHQFGDEILRIVAQRLNFHTRDEDQLCRLGGDEFAVIMQGRGPEPFAENTSEAVAKKIISTIDAPIRFDGRTIEIGVAIGIAYYPQTAITARELVAAADKALYAAKARNRLSAGSSYVVSA